MWVKKVICLKRPAQHFHDLFAVLVNHLLGQTFRKLPHKVCEAESPRSNISLCLCFPDLKKVTGFNTRVGQAPGWSSGGLKSSLLWKNILWIVWVYKTVYFLFNLAFMYFISMIPNITIPSTTRMQDHKSHIFHLLN